jgi:hypothetical protein
MSSEVDVTGIQRTASQDCGIRDSIVVREATSAFFQWFSILPTLSSTDLPYVMDKGPVDSVWHAFILHTEAYRSFCSKYLGRFLDHYPRHDRPPQAWIDFTLGRLRAHFGSDLHPYLECWSQESRWSDGGFTIRLPGR